MNRVCDKDELVLAHTEVQMGTFLSHRQQLAPGLWYVYSRHIQDFYWNHACLSGVVSDFGSEQRQAICREARRQNRAPAVFRILEPAPEIANPAGQEEELVLDAWLTREVGSMEAETLPPGLSVNQVCDTGSLAEFLEVFRDAYRPDGAEEAGYCCLAESYPQALATASPPADVHVRHFLGRYGGHPVAIASVFWKNHLAGLYNVGTVHSARRRHFAHALSRRALEAAFEAGCGTVFLQTEPDSILEQMYRRLGFERQFLGGFALLEPGSERDRLPFR